MKKIIIILLALFSTSLFSCREYEMIEYGKGGEINFVGRYFYSDTWWVWDEDPTYLAWETNFGINPKGDSLLVDTLMFGVKIMGLTTDFDRKITFKVIAPEENALEVMLPDDCYMPADTNMIAVKIPVKRPDKKNVVYSTQLTFDYAQSDFSAGTLERQYFELEAMDSVSIELWGMSAMEWEYYGAELEYFFGPMSDTKIRYIITSLGVTNLKIWYDSGDYMFVLFDDILYNSLQEYKSNPDNPPLIDENTGDWIYFPSINDLL